MNVQLLTIFLVLIICTLSTATTQCSKDLDCGMDGECSEGLCKNERVKRGVRQTANAEYYCEGNGDCEDRSDYRTFCYRNMCVPLWLSRLRG